MFDLAARVSKDGIMPDGSQGANGSVIIANAEDDLHDTIKPRLLAAGAIAERLFHISEVGPAGARRPLRIPADVPLIGRFIKECSARLLIVDPLTAFLAGLPGLPSADAQRLQHAGQEREGGVRRRRLQRANDRTGGQQTRGGFEAEVRDEHVGAAGRRHVTPIRTRPLNAIGEKVDVQARNRGNCRKRYSPRYSPSGRQLASSFWNSLSPLNQL